ncbi:hypothetical protein Dsin_022309 [Dipteronia sinensis]|uniref:Uncharacterized protein n=1 Tax=Dipteronia sinensis TaxID=43782 RepID=A0AAE0DZY2_9ROSI|nr:hypothetical protein Dsin_022309 [Dipteronia sinensis]
MDVQLLHNVNNNRVLAWAKRPQIKPIHKLYTHNEATSFSMDFNTYVGSVCHLFEEIRAYMARIFIRIVQFHPRKLETSPTLCINGMLGVLGF